MKKIFLPLLLLISVFANAQDPTPKIILQKYIDAIGGEKAINLITDFTMDAEGMVQGQTITMQIIKKLPNKFRAIVTVDGMGEVNKTIFDGKKGRITNMGQDQDLEEARIEEISDKANIIPEQGLLQKLDSLEYKGKETIDGAECYVINIKNGGTKVMEYFDTKSGLLTRQTTEMITEMGSTKMITDYKDFRDINKVKFPFIIKQDMGMMSMEFNVTSLKTNSGVLDDVFMIN